MKDEDLFRTRTVVSQDTASLSLEGELDIATAPLLLTAVGRSVRDHPQHLDLDVAALGFCDAAGVRALLQARRVCRAHGTEFRLTGVRPRFHRILAMLRVADLLAGQASPHGIPRVAVSPEPL
ncbi:STAS domain-containing protein [Streptomyces sp. 1331.2]|uniref:STAS domain-containing protein n=1 Tax=Streptomyces sp. 1331.2 TaxID=1938835 RepID=UPI000BD3956B|nr:anti-sigma-factor antagonist [Streptomyces sp. 1331.2]